MDKLMVIVLLCGSLLMIIGGLIGHSLSQYLLAGDLRRSAELRRQIGEHRRGLIAERERQERSRCQHCGMPRPGGQTSDAGRVEALT